MSMAYWIARRANCALWSWVNVDEFGLITRYLNNPALGFPGDGVDLGIGDDAALLSLGEDEQLVLSMDVLQVGIHFPADCDPALLAQRALRVNLSDLAAMAAEPVCFTLGLCLPDADALWLQRFCEGLAEVAREAGCPLVGGDTTSGALTICIQVHGKVPKGQALLRSGAAAGDELYVTGTLGDAAAALALVAPAAAAAEIDVSTLDVAARQQLLDAYYRPRLQLAFARGLRGLGSAAIDVSDGLAGDLRHLLRASALCAEVSINTLPLSAAFRAAVPASRQLSLALSGGDDYQICFSAPPQHAEAIVALARRQKVPLTRIGRLLAASDSQPAGSVRWLDAEGQSQRMPDAGYRHFAIHQD